MMVMTVVMMMVVVMMVITSTSGPYFVFCMSPSSALIGADVS